MHVHARMQELYRRLEFSLVKRRIERGIYFWSVNAREMAMEARCRHCVFKFCTVCVYARECVQMCRSHGGRLLRLAVL